MFNNLTISGNINVLFIALIFLFFSLSYQFFKGLFFLMPMCTCILLLFFSFYFQKFACCYCNGLNCYRLVLYLKIFFRTICLQALFHIYVSTNIYIRYTVKHFLFSLFVVLYFLL